MQIDIIQIYVLVLPEKFAVHVVFLFISLSKFYQISAEVFVFLPVLDPFYRELALMLSHVVLEVLYIS